MITVKYIPNLFENKERKIMEVPYQPGMTLNHCIRVTDFPSGGQKFILSGRRVTDTTLLVEDGDELIITPDIQDIGAFLAATWKALVAWVSAHPIQAIFTIASIGAGIYSALQRPRLPSFGGGGNEEDSPTYGWDGMRTMQDVGIPIPIIAGEHKVAGNILNQFISVEKEYDWNWTDITPTNVSNSGNVNTFRVNSNSRAIKFNLNVIYSTPGGKNLAYYASYRVEYKKTVDGSYTLFNESVGGGRVWYRRGGGVRISKWQVQINDLEGTTYDIRITLREDWSAYHDQAYYSDVEAIAQVPTVTRPDKQFLNVLLALGEGEIEEIKDIKLDDNPLANFTDVELVQRTGTNSQIPIPGFEESHDIHSVNVQLTKDSPHIYTTDGSDIEAIEITLRLPNGLFLVDQNSGAVEVWTVSYKVEYKLHAAGEYTDAGTHTISYKTRSQVDYKYKLEKLTPGQYDIRVTRVSDNSDFYHTGDLYFHDADEIKYDNDMAYPNTALLALKHIPVDQLKGTLTSITCIVRGIKMKMPKVIYGGAEVNWEDYYWDSTAEKYKRFSDETDCTWDGSTYVTRWGANGIWFVYNLLVASRYGAGEFIAEANLGLADFVAMSKVCEERVPDGDGGYEKRFRFDAVLDSSRNLLDLLTQICATMRAMVFYSEGAIKIVIDKEEDPVQLFGMGNISANSFTQAWKSIRDRPNVIEVQYLDRDKDYEQETISYADQAALDAGEPMRKISLRLFVTRCSQVIREARYAVKQAKYISRTSAFRAGIDALACQAGDVISTSHDVPVWGLSGRVQTGSTTTKVKLDRTITIEGGKTYKVMVRFADDSIEERTVTDGVGSYTEVNVNPAFTQAPAVYDVYAFGENNKVKKDFRVCGMRRENSGEMLLSLTEYSVNVYDDSDVNLPADNYSMLNLEIPNVVNLELSERLVKLGDGTIEDVIDVWFQKPVQTDYHVKRWAKAKIYLSEDAGYSWTEKGENITGHFPIQGGIKDGRTYYVAVVSVTAKGEEGSIKQSPTDNITVVGKSAKPEDVSSFSVKQDGDELIFSWAPNPDVDLAGYEIRENNDWAGGTVVETDIKHTSYRRELLSIGEFRFMIKAKDTSGNYSENAAVCVIEVTEGIDIKFHQDNQLFDVIAGDISFDTENTPNIVDENGDQVIDASSDNVIANGIYTLVQRWNGSQEYLELLRYYNGTYVDYGTFFAAPVNLGLKLKIRLNITLQAAGENSTYIIYISTSDNGVDYSDWALFADGVYDCQYFKIAVLLATNNINNHVRLFALYSRGTIKYDEDGDEDVSIGATGETINFNKTFRVKVRVFVIAQGVKYARITAKSLTQFTVEVRDDATGSLTSGVIDWQAKGY